jgi:predicted ester cyclase
VAAEVENVVSLCIEVWNTGEISLLDDLLADDYIGHVGASDHDGAELGKRIVAYRQRQPGVRFTLLDQISDGVRIASSLEANAEVDGKSVRQRGVNISVVVDGRLLEEWAVWEAST